MAQASPAPGGPQGRPPHTPSASAPASPTYIQALTLTSVANVAAISATAPLFAPLAGLFVLRERVAPLIWAAIVLGPAGIAGMMADGLQAGGLKGNLIALGVPISSALVIIVVRRWSRRRAIALAATSDLSIPLHDAGLSLLLGFVQIGIGFTLLNIGARHVLAAEGGRFALAEPVLSPLWVWTALDEVPTTLPSSAPAWSSPPPAAPPSRLHDERLAARPSLPTSP